MEKQSLTELSKNIDCIIKKYDIEGFVVEFKNIFKSINHPAHDEMEALSKQGDVADGSHIDKIMSVSKKLTNEDLEYVVKASKKLNIKYKYEKFSEEAEAARKNFLDSRNDYFSVRATRGTDRGGIFNSYIDQSGISDLMLAEWIGRLLERIYPYSLRIKYEELDGKFVETRIAHREAIVTNEFVEAPLLTRYTGKNNFDRFILHSFFDVNKNKWVYVPLRLIVDLTSPEGINIYDIDME